MQGLLILLILVVIALTLWLSTGIRPNGAGPYLKRPGVLLVGAIVLIAVFYVMAGIVIVDSGERGVVIRFGAVTGQTLDEGLHIINPISESVQKMSVQTNAFEAGASAGSRDMQSVSTTVTVNYALDPGKVGEIYRTLRRDYTARIIAPSVQESVKAVTAKYSAEQLISKREEVKLALETSLRNRLNPLGIMVSAVSITNFDFSETFNKAIEAKVEAEQQALKAQRDLERVKLEAEQKVASARAEAESLRLQRQQVSPEMIKMKWIEKWDGKMPTYMGNGTPLINMGGGN